MADQTDTQAEKNAKAPRSLQGVDLQQTATIDGIDINYRVIADWTILRKKEKPNAEMFSIAYLKNDADPRTRPITFVFNGGPGASSAYLHMGALGPQRVAFNSDGTLTPPPVKVLENQESWLKFTDLVFIDPIGTGFSRLIDDEKLEGDKKGEKKAEPKDELEYFKMNRDLESIGEFIQEFFSKQKRWTSPCYIAGESYGGFRTAKLSRMLQADYGIGLNGAILISPCLDWAILASNDYSIESWVHLFPSFVAASCFHEKTATKMPLSEALMAAEKFASDQLSKFYVQGADMPEAEQNEVFQKYSELTGIPADIVKLKHARINYSEFTRLLLKSEQNVLGLYDATQKIVDPFPDRETHQAPDSTLGAAERIFCSGVNSQLRERFGLEVERDYKLISIDVNMKWKNDKQTHAFDLKVDATDDLRFALSLNPFLKLFITHGYHDLVTPYFAADRLVNQMRLSDEHRSRISLKHYVGGHMFYTWEESRKQFTKDMEQFFNSSH